MSAWLPGPGWLFCPADRPERYVKALDRADVVILDLEDAVARPAKAAARDAVRRLAETGGLDLERTVVRVNAADDAEEHAHDVALLAAAGVRRVMLAKAEEPAAVAALAAGGAHEVLPLLETPRGIENAGSIAATDGVVAVMWGADDLVAAMGGTGSRRADGSYRDVARYARERTLIAAKAHGRLALDAVHMDIADTDGLTAAAEDAAAVGFDATVAIHPSQVAVVRAAYAPSPERLGWAEGLLAAYPDGLSGAGGVGTYEGRMVDGPIFAQARTVLRRAAATSQQKGGEA